METDKSNSNGKLFSNNLCSKASTNGDLHNDNFLMEFFPELTVTEVDSFPKQNKGMQQEENMMNGHKSLLIDDLSIQNEKLKQMNKELKEKSIQQESQIAKYEVDLSEKMQDVLSVNQELEKVKEQYRELKNVKEDLEKEMTQLKVQVEQLLDTRDKSNEANNQIIELQKDITSREKAQRRLRNELELTTQKLLEKNGNAKKMKSYNKKLWNIIMEMSETLSKNGLLTVRRKEQFLKEIDDQMSVPEVGFDGENIKTFFCGLSTVSSPSRRTSKNCSEIPCIERQHNHPAATNTEVTSNLKSYKSNYFMKTHKEVIEDLVSEDYNELNNFRKQLSVRHDPISPLPPTPPPKNGKFKDNSRPPIFPGKKLNFFHQQSESFEVQNVEPIEKPPLMLSDSPVLNPNQYLISSKLNPDGSLKLDFSANYDTYLSFDMNTRKVSCTVMPIKDSSSRSPNHVNPNRLENISNGQDVPAYNVGSEEIALTGATDNERSPQKIKPDFISNQIQKPVTTISSSEQKENDQEDERPTNSSLPHEKKTLSDIGRSGKVYSAFVSPSEKRVTIPSVRVSPRQVKAVSTNLECPMEIDNHQQSPVDSQNKISRKNSKKRKTPSKKANNSKDSTLTNKCKKKSSRMRKKRKTSEFEHETNNEVLEQNNSPDGNDEKDSKKLAHRKEHHIVESPKHLSPNQSKSELQKDDMLQGISEISNLFKEPSVENEDAKEEANVISDSPKKVVACPLSEETNDIDFSDIQVSPFNPSTFVPRGLFLNELPNLEDNQKLDKEENNFQQIAVCANGDINSPKKSSEAHLNDMVSDAENNLNKTNSNVNLNTLSSDVNLNTLSNDVNLNTLSNGHFESNTINCNDGLDSDHSLVIAEDVEQNIAEHSLSPNKSETTVKGGTRKRKKSNKKPPVKKCSKKKEVPEVVDVVTIEAAFKSLEEMKFTDAHFKQHQHTLVNALLNPINAAGSKEIVYLVLKYLLTTRANPLIGYFMSNDENLLMPLKEKCIVQALFQISRKKKSRLHDFLPSLVNTAYELIITKESMQIYGLSSLCRILTEVCKELGDKRLPLMLCSELLKLQHKYTPYLIASMAGVWKDLFSIEDASDEELIFHFSIVYGTQRKPSTLNEQQWKHCSKVLSTYLTAQLPHKINEIVAFLIKRIETKSLTGASFEEFFLNTTPLIVFTAVEGWSWAKEILIDQYIIPLLVKFSEQEVNENAFTIFCQLYADICYFCPNEEDPHEVFMEFFNYEDEGTEFVRNAAAMSQLKLLLHKRQLLPEHLTEWVQNIQDQTDYVEYAESLFQRRIMNTEAQFLDIEVR